METNEQDLLTKLIQSISELAANPIPIDKRLWNADDCSQYLRIAKKTFQSYYAPHPKFPKRIELDRSGGKSNPLWRAGDVIEWAISRGK